VISTISCFAKTSRALRAEMRPDVNTVRVNCYTDNCCHVSCVGRGLTAAVTLNSLLWRCFIPP
jgi:hypothetical protein